MSGGHFDYQQYKIREIAEAIEEKIEKNGKPLSREELKYWNRDEEWYERYPEDKCHHKYPDEVIEKFKEGVEVLKKAEIYAQRIDYLLSGDDGEESFLKRLKQELNERLEK